MHAGEVRGWEASEARAEAGLWHRITVERSRQARLRLAQLRDGLAASTREDDVPELRVLVSEVPLVRPALKVRVQRASDERVRRCADPSPS